MRVQINQSRSTNCKSRILKFRFENYLSQVITFDLSRYLHQSNSWIPSFFRVAKRSRVIRPNLLDWQLEFLIPFLAKSFCLFLQGFCCVKVSVSFELYISHYVHCLFCFQSLKNFVHVMYRQWLPHWFQIIFPQVFLFCIVSETIFSK